jgi:putative ABC transport system ATP-binding protein
MTTLIQLEKLSKDFAEGGQTRAILHETTAAFAAGEFAAIRGRSGSGKSTLLNLIAGIDTPTGGEIYIDERCVTRLNERERTLFRRDHIGFIFQFFNLIPTLTVLENVRLPAELAGRSGQSVTARALDLLERVSLADRRDTFPDKLSGGEQQRVAIARALVHDPRLILADEPTGNLDDATGAAVMSLLEEMTRQAGKTLILVTHSRKVAALADRRLTIDHGQLVPEEEFRIQESGARREASHSDS